MIASGERPPAGRTYARACTALARAHGRIVPRQRDRHRDSARQELLDALRITRLPLDLRTVVNAARMAAIIAGAGALAVFAASSLFLGFGQPLIFVPLAIAAPLLLSEAIMRYPSALSKRIAAEVVKDSSAAVNLMVMSLRREPSLSTAISFSAARCNRFSAELKACTWGVVMGRFASFEEALQDLAERWSAQASELKTAINALITASCEATEDGRRRALDRASSASVQGVKRRIGEYALSLSTPSMVMFGLAILLPLMVGSFLPMMSWDVWTGESGANGGAIGTGSTSLLQVVFMMNFVFPAIGLLVSLGSVAKHPLKSREMESISFKGSWRLILTVIASSACLTLVSVIASAGVVRSVAVLLSVTVPISLALLHAGTDGKRCRTWDPGNAEESLFRTGARMVEGANLEQALSESARDRSRSESHSALGGSLAMFLRGVPSSGAKDRNTIEDTQSYEALSVVRAAATKDERAAGLLAMDIATYIRDLRETERSLRSRLKPTISMMKMTCYALAPVVLGVTFGMYMTLGAISGGGSGSLDPSAFILVLGAFLAESNAVVQYFIWGIETAGSVRTLASSIGTCMLLSELVFVGTAIVAS